MKSQVTKICGCQVNITCAFICNPFWNITVFEFNTKHHLSLNSIQDFLTERLLKKLWCENNYHARSFSWHLPVCSDVISVCLHHSNYPSFYPQSVLFTVIYVNLRILWYLSMKKKIDLYLKACQFNILLCVLSAIFFHTLNNHVVVYGLLCCHDMV